MTEQRRALWYTECIAPVVGALVSGQPLLTIGGVTNGDLVEWLPPETMLEVPVEIDAGGVRALPIVDELAVESRTLLLANATYEQLTVEAVLTGDRPAAIQALAANPIVPSVAVAAHAVELIEAEFGPITRRV